VFDHVISMFNYKDLFTAHHIATLADWFEEKGEVFLQIELPHSGGSGLYQTVHSVAEVKRYVEQVTNPEITILIWKNRTKAQLESDVPFPDDLKWVYLHNDEVMYFAVTKNRNSSASYITDPGKYSDAIKQWFAD
jgi:hypothetical protein